MRKTLPRLHKMITVRLFFLSPSGMSGDPALTANLIYLDEKSRTVKKLRKNTLPRTIS